ncbi:MAG: DNA repair exonuclease [Akkermansiaceae bacterium]|jgi:DNA repair exonuclease SbcCD nuclease subunit|nr:DNA repair exonuclease [Akkermansiaceae bacterium]
MTTTFLHSADWQIGKPFGSLDDESKRQRLRQERIDAIVRLGRIAREVKARFVLVAGDLFDSPHVTKATVSATCAAVGAIGLPVLVIPGNHDHGGPGSIWEQEFFQRERDQLAPNLRVLLEATPVVLDEAIVFPAPLLRRHEAVDPTAWIRAALVDDSSLPAGLPRIVLAHGTIQGFSARQDDDEAGPVTANHIDLAAMPDAAFDYIALGDWHGTKQVAPKAWYSGTPETDRFPRGEGNDPGNVLKVSVTRGGLPEVVKIPSGRLGWREMAFDFSGDDGPEILAARLAETIGSQGDQNLLLLSLRGVLGIAAANRLDAVLESWESRLLRLKLDSQITLVPSDAEVAALTRRAEDPLIAAVATELVRRCQGESEDAAIARLALRELHAALA